MQLTKIEKEVYERLKADAGAGSLQSFVSDRIYSGFAPEKAVKPYVVAWVRIPSLDLGFNVDIANVAITVEIYCAGPPPANIGQAQSIIDRVYGNSAAGSAPTFGLHRWKPTLEGDWSGDTIVAESADPNHDENTTAYLLTFRMIQSK